MDPEVDLALQGGSRETAYSNPMQLKRAFASMNELRRHGLLCDVTLVVDSSPDGVDFAEGVRLAGHSVSAELRCHKLVLAASSAYFRAMFTNDGFPEARSERVVLGGVDAEALRAAVEYMYTGRCEVTDGNAFALLALSSMAQMDELRAACCAFLQANMSVANCLVALRFGELHLCADLYDYALRFIAANFSAVAHDPQLSDALSADAFCTLLRNDRLAVADEDQVLDAVVRWLTPDSAAQARLRREPATVRRVMEHVRMPLLRGETLLQLAQDDTFAFIREADADRRWLIEALAFHLRRNQDRERAEQQPEVRDAKSESDSESNVTSDGDDARGAECSDAAKKVEHLRLTETQQTVESCVRVAVGSSVRFRARCASSASAARQLVVVGGQSPDAMRDVEAYSFRSARWQHVTVLPARRGRHGAAFAGGSLFVVGGFNGSQRVRTCDRFDVRTREWHAAPPLNTRRCTVGCCVRGEALFAVGGFDGQMGLATVELLALDSDAAEWRYTAAMGTRRSSVGVTAVRRLDELVAAVGGYDGAARQFLQTAELYDPHRDVWSVTAPMTSRRSGAATSADLWTVYAVGGQDGPLVKNTVERFDVREGEWRLVAPMRFCRRNAAAAVNDADGCVYVCGGDDGRMQTDTVEVYDPRADAWTMLDSRMLFERTFAAAAIISV